MGEIVLNGELRSTNSKEFHILKWGAEEMASSVDLLALHADCLRVQGPGDKINWHLTLVAA